ncbi:hypothetical protein AGLY_004314 [Aphis glycines]|uniref:Uncharacterized protein n=1 Tax=Aphis glycines TaxID=307491 RepID=A0A6G0TXP8_APHGL|nr:hypothetical protein AGLY_004314 [Aphis glycines]
MDKAVTGGSGGPDPSPSEIFFNTYISKNILDPPPENFFSYISVHIITIGGHKNFTLHSITYYYGIINTLIYLTILKDTQRRLKWPDVSPLISFSRLCPWVTYVFPTVRTPKLLKVHNISTSTSSWVPNPEIASCNSFAYNSGSGVINANTVSSKCPLTSAISMRCTIPRLAITSTFFRAVASSFASKFGDANTNRSTNVTGRRSWRKRQELY